MKDASQNFPLTIVQNATLIRTITYYNTDGTVVDLTGYTAIMNFRTTVEDTGDPIIALTTDDNSIVIGGISGTITFTISPALSSPLTNEQQMVYNLFIYSPTGVVTPLLAGPAYVQGSTI